MNNYEAPNGRTCMLIFSEKMCTLIVHYYQNPVRLFIFEKRESPVRLLGPVWLFGASEYLRSQ